MSNTLTFFKEIWNLIRLIKMRCKFLILNFLNPVLYLMSLRILATQPVLSNKYINTQINCNIMSWRGTFIPLLVQYLCGVSRDTEWLVEITWFKSQVRNRQVIITELVDLQYRIHWIIYNWQPIKTWSLQDLSCKLLN